VFPINALFSFNNTVKIKTNFNNYNFWYMKFYENLMQATANLSTTPDNYHCPTMRKVDLMQLMGAKPFPLRLGWSENVMVLHSNLQLRQVSKRNCSNWPSLVQTKASSLCSPEISYVIHHAVLESMCQQATATSCLHQHQLTLGIRFPASDVSISTLQS